MSASNFTEETQNADDMETKAKDFYWYHSVSLGNGVITSGDYDMNEYLHHYHFPVDMRGLSVLDVGRASGFFSFFFEERGASVTATEIRSFMDWDFVGGDIEKKKRASNIRDMDAYTRRYITGAFDFAHAARNSNVTSKIASIYDVRPETVGGPFDIVFAGSVTSHLRDPILGLERLRSVIAPDGLCVVSAPFIDIQPDLPVAAMVGTADEDHRSWWVVNAKCLTEMLHSAGFSKVEMVGFFNLKMTRDTGRPNNFPHIVAHARV